MGKQQPAKLELQTFTLIWWRSWDDCTRTSYGIKCPSSFNWSGAQESLLRTWWKSWHAGLVSFTISERPRSGRNWYQSSSVRNIQLWLTPHSHHGDVEGKAWLQSLLLQRMRSALLVRVVLLLQRAIRHDLEEIREWITVWRCFVSRRVEICIMVHPERPRMIRWRFEKIESGVSGAWRKRTKTAVPSCHGRRWS